MLKHERASFVMQRLEQLYPETPVPLDHNNIFELLVAVLLSAQCTDERVNQVTPTLFALADNAAEMQHVPREAIYRIVRPCGLAPQKSKAISMLSTILVEQYDGEVPNNLAALETLPGVGHKTASVVMSQGFGQPAFPVDTHIHRLAQRWPALAVYRAEVRVELRGSTPSGARVERAPRESHRRGHRARRV